MNRRGGILVEAVIATALVGVAMIAVAQLLSLAIRRERILEHRRVATNEAANALEQALAVDWEASDETRLAELAANTKSSLPNGILRFKSQTVADGPPARQITAEVEWRNHWGHADQVHLTVWKYQGGRP